MFKHTFLFSSAIVLALGAAVPAAAQDFEDEIIVTATKRTTTLQETPVAVTVTNAATIERAKILDVNDLQSVVPSLRVNQLQSSQNTNFIIRGQGNGANNGGIESSVGVFVDGVYRSRSSARVNDLPKLERVEVLKGPQSTLFGKNASAGVISIVTAEPSYETEGYAEFTYGNYDQMIAKGYITTGLSDTFAVSLGGGINKRDGYVESVIGLDSVNDRNRFNIRGQALWEPDDLTKVRLIADYSEIDENCCGVTNLVAGPVTNIFQALSGLTTPATPPVSDPFTYMAYQNKDSVNEIEDKGISLQIDRDFENIALTSITAYRSNDSFYDTDADYSLTAMLDGVGSDLGVDTFTQELRLTSTGDSDLDWMLGGYYFKEDVAQNSNLDYGAALRPYLDFLIGDPSVLAGLEAANGFAPGSFGSADVNIREFFTQDNTYWSLFGTADYHVSDRLTLSGGLNYTKDKKAVSGFSINPDEFSNLDLAGEGAENFFELVTFLQGADPIPNVFPGLPSFEDAFGLPFTQANVITIATNPLTATAFGQYSAFVEAYAAGVAASPDNPLLGIQAFQTQPQFLAFPNAVEDGRSSDEKVTWQIRAAYEVSDNLNVYGSVATGFKATSWSLSRDSRPAAGDMAALAAAGLLPNNVNAGSRLAGPEKVITYEIGAKTRFDGGFLNVALFQQDFDALQTNAFVGSNFVFTNAGELRIRGIELDGAYELFEGFKVSGAATLLDPEFTDFRGATGPVGPIDRTGEMPDNVSKTSLSLGATYEHDFDNGTSAYVRGDWQYESDAVLGRNLTPDSLDLVAAAGTSLSPFYAPQARTTYPGYETRNQSIVNGSMGIDFDNGFALQIWGRNLFNDRYISTIFPGVFQFGVVNGYPSPPRTYGITGRYNF